MIKFYQPKPIKEYKKEILRFKGKDDDLAYSTEDGFVTIGEYNEWAKQYCQAKALADMIGAKFVPKPMPMPKLDY